MGVDINDLMDMDDNPEPFDKTSGLPIMSRRSLLSGAAAATLAMGGMMMLPKVEGGVLFPVFGAQTAYADSGSGSFTFTVVGADQVGFQILDAATIDDKGNGTPIKDAVVTLTSRFNNLTVSGTTDKKGTVILGIAPIAFEQDPANHVYYANASISVKSSKSARTQIRDFSAGLVTLEGATAVSIGVQKADSTDVYMERCTFDDWDIHYSRNTFLRSAKNQEDHVIFIRIKGTTKDVPLTMTIMDADKKETLVTKASTTAKLNSNSGFVEGSFKGRYLQTGHKDCITKDEAVLCIKMTVDKGSNETDTIETDIKVYVEDTPIDEAVANAAIIPFMTDADSLFNFSASGDWPCFNGLSFGVMNPAFPLQISSSLLATVIGIGTDIRLKGDDGKPSLTDWMKDHKGNVIQRYKNLRTRQNSEFKARQEQTAEKNGSMVEMNDIGDDNPKGVAQKNEFLKNFDFNLIGRFLLAIEYGGLEGQDKNLMTKWVGYGTIEVGFNATGTLTLEFMLGALPAFASGSLGLTAILAFTETIRKQQLRTVRELDCSKLTYSMDKALSLLLKIALTISLGVGYKGLASLSFDSTFEFPFYFGWFQKEGQGKANPHITIGVSILLEVVFQCLLFKLSGQIYSYEKKDWYNNWNKKNDGEALTGDAAWEGLEPRFRLTQPDGTLRHSLIYSNDGRLLVGDPDDPFASAVPVTNAMMTGSREADAKSIGKVTEIDEEAEAARFVQDADDPDVFRRDDGTVVYKDKLAKPVVDAKGNFSTELIDCKGVNTFYFGDSTSDAGKAAQTQAAVLATAAASSATAKKATAALNLVAEADGGPVFAGDPMLGFALGADEEYSYTYVAGKTTGAYCGLSEITALGAYDGVAPSVDAVIYKDVHSDPRQRVVSIGGVPYLFRVITVSYPTAKGQYCRSRVVASAFDLSTYTWGTPKVIEYNTGNKDLPRVDMYDYEFDIAVRSGSGKWTQDAEACLIVTGGLRPQDDATTFYDVASNPTVAIVLIDKDLNVVQRSVRSVDMFDDGKAHMLFSPCVVDGFAPNGASGVLSYALLHRSATNKFGLTRNGAQVNFMVGYVYACDDYLCVPETLKVGPALDAAVFGIKGVAGDAVSGKYDALFTLLSSRQGGYDVCTATIPPKGSFADLAIRHCIAGSEALPEIQPWPHHGTFLFVKARPATPDSPTPDYHLYEGSFDPAKEGQSGFTPNQMDALGLKGASFCVSPSGNFIFYYESYRDKPGDDPKADMVSRNVSGTGDDTVYHIMASRLLNGKFCEDFPFCEVAHPIDHIEILEIGDNASAFVATHIKDADKSLADLHYISVPNTLAADIDSFTQVGPFVFAGHSCPFQADIRNHGNLIIGGFDLQMLDPDRGNIVVDSVHVGQIEPKDVMLGAANLGWGDSAADAVHPVPTLTDEEKKGWLMPGKVVSYQAMFKIPDDWKNDKRVIMRIVKSWTPGVQEGSLATAAGESGGAAGSVVHFYGKGASNSIVVQEAQSTADLYLPKETVKKDKKDPDDPEKKTPQAGTVPKTDDSLGALEPFMAALGGAAALMAGYSARRAQIEREEQEGGEA